MNGNGVIRWVVLLTVMAEATTAGESLLQTSFAADGALEGWTKENQTLVSPIFRREGTRSLLIKQWKDEWRCPLYCRTPCVSPTSVSSSCCSWPV